MFMPGVVASRLVGGGGWDLANASYDSVSFELTEDGGYTDIFFKPDGTKMYVTANSSDLVLQYVLSSAWDLSTASYDNKSFNISQATTPEGIYFKEDGTIFYVVNRGTGSSTRVVHQYNVSTPWDITTSSYSGVSATISTQETSPRSIFLKDDGTKLFLVGTTGATLYQYSLSTPWVISSLSYDSISFSVSGEDTSPTTIHFKPDGLTAFIIGTNSGIVFQYDLTTAWDLTAISYSGISFLVKPNPNFPSSVRFNQDGTKMYTYGSNFVYQFTVP